jgi:archaellum component FlaC
VDALAQLEVGEGGKKKKKGSDARISIPVKTSGPNPAAVGQAANVEGEVKSPTKKKSRTLSRKTKKDRDVTEVDKDLIEVEDPAVEASPAAEKTIVEASQAWDPLFDPEVFLARMMDMAGNSACFNTTGSDELMRLALGYELKGLLLNYALASRQRADLAAAKEKEALVEKNLATLEEDVKAAKERCEGDVKALKEKSEEEIAKLTKEYEEELAKAKRDRESAIKTMNTVQGSLNANDERIKTLAKDNEALAELAILRREKAKWESEKDGLEATIGEQYEEGFQFALDQVKVLFPDIDQDLLGKADAMSTIEGDKLVPHAPAEMVQDSPAKESPAKEPPAQESPAKE